MALDSDKQDKPVERFEWRGFQDSAGLNYKLNANRSPKALHTSCATDGWALLGPFIRGRDGGERCERHNCFTIWARASGSTTSHENFWIAALSNTTSVNCR